MGDYFRQAKKDYEDSITGHVYQEVIDAFKNRYGDYYYTFFHLTEFPDSNVNSMINYSVAVEGMMEKYLAYLGCDIQVVDIRTDRDRIEEAAEIVRITGMQSYCVMETEEYIIATLQIS